VSRDRFMKLAKEDGFEDLGGGNAITLDEQEVTGRIPERDRILDMLRSLGILADEDAPAAMDRATGLVRGVAEGATAGWVDELAGGLAAGMSEEQRRGLGRLMAPEGQEDRYADAAARVTYEDVRDTARGQQARAAEAAPGQFIAGSVGGALGVGRFIPQAGAGMSGGSAVGARIAQAAGEGVLAGAGGSQAADMEGIAEDAATGGAIGGGIAGGIAGIGGLGRLLRAAQGGVTQTADDAARVSDSITELERIGSPIESDRIRFKPATLREALAREPADPSAVDDAMDWFADMQERIRREFIDQGRYGRSGRAALANLRAELNDQTVRAERAIERGNVGEVYAALDQGKRAIGRMQGRVGPMRGRDPNPNADPQAAEALREWYGEVRAALERPEWGGASALQRGDNPAWTAAIPARRIAARRFLEDSPERPNEWDPIQRAKRPAVESTMQRAAEPAEQDYVDDLVRYTRTRADLVQRLGRHYGSPLAETAADRAARATPEGVPGGYRDAAPRVDDAVDSAQVRRARELADGVDRIVSAARNPSTARRVGQVLARSPYGRAAATAGDVAGQPLEAIGEAGAQAASRGAPRAAATVAATPRAPELPVAETDDERVLQMLPEEPDETDDERVMRMLGD